MQPKRALSLILLLWLLSGCATSSPPLCCPTEPPPVSSTSVPTTTTPVDTPPAATGPIPLRIYDLTQSWTPELRKNTAKTILLSGLPQDTYPLTGATVYSLAPDRCRISSPRFGMYGEELHVELLVGKAILVAGGVLICDDPQLAGTTVAIAEASVLEGSTWSFRTAAAAVPAVACPTADADVHYSGVFSTTLAFDPEQAASIDGGPIFTLVPGEPTSFALAQGGQDLIIVANEERTDSEVQRTFNVALPSPDGQCMPYGSVTASVGQAVAIPGGILAYLESTEAGAVVQMWPIRAYDLLFGKR